MNTVKEGKMWFLHCQLLTEIMVHILKKIKDEKSEVVTFLDNLFQEKILNTFHNDIRGEIVNSQNDSEYRFFKKFGREHHEDEIHSIIHGLSGPAYRVASDLTYEDLDREKNKITDLTKTALWYILAIGYFNRKICLGAEGVVKKEEKCHNRNEKNWYEKNKSRKVNEILAGNGKSETQKNDSNAMQLFLNCLRPRLNYIGAHPWIKYLFKKIPYGENEIDNYTVEDLVGLSKSLSTDKTLDVPFSKQIHRLRKQPEDNPSDVHLLGIDAGAHINAITQESTLGKIRKSLGLPLRCDISGTTVDAMGFCDTFIEKDQRGNNNVKRMVYLVSCMLSMCLTGHHSLDEMALALSLDVSKQYDPCNPTTVIGLLKEWSGWADFPLFDTNYYKSQAAEILDIENLDLKELKFTKQLWDGLAVHNKIMKGWKYEGDELKPPLPQDDDGT